jgi:hypothetical protein
VVALKIIKVSVDHSPPRRLLLREKMDPVDVDLRMEDEAGHRRRHHQMADEDPTTREEDVVAEGQL